MRQIFFILGMMLLSFSIIASYSINDGSWYNPHSKRTIFITHQRDGLKIKSIHSRYGWTWFERCGKNTFCDRYDNVIKTSGRSKIVYFKRDRRTRLTFYPVSKRNYDRRSRNYHEEDDWYSDNDRSDSRVNEYEEEGQNRRENDGTIKRRNINNSSPEGTWKSTEFDKKVYIVDTRDGLKARFSDDPRWFIFKTDSKNYSLFIGDKGHRYEYIDENNLLWIDGSGQRKYKLTKVSDEID